MGKSVDVGFVCCEVVKGFVDEVSVEMDVGSILRVVMIVVGEEGSVVCGDENGVCIDVVVDEKKIGILKGMVRC